MIVGHLAFIMGGWGYYIDHKKHKKTASADIEFDPKVCKFYFVTYLSIMGVKNWMSNWKMWRLSVMVED